MKSVTQTVNLTAVNNYTLSSIIVGFTLLYTLRTSSLVQTDQKMSIGKSLGQMINVRLCKRKWAFDIWNGLSLDQIVTLTVKGVEKKSISSPDK